MEARQEEQVAVVGRIPTSWSREMVEAMVAILKVRDARLAAKGTFILATRHKLTYIKCFKSCKIECTK